MIKLALIGTGWAAKSYATIESNIFKIEAVVGTSIDKAKEFANKYNIPCFYDKIENICCNTSIKGIIICTPPHISIKIAKFFLQNNYDVLIEKPGAESSQELIELSQFENNSRAFIAYQLRYDSNIKLIQKLIKSDEFKNIDYGYFRMFFPGLMPNKESYRKWSIGRNAPSVWVESGVHLIDLSTLLLGEIYKFKTVNTKYGNQVISGSSIIEHTTGCRSTLDISFCGQENNIRGLFELYSSDGMIEIHRGSYINKETFLIAEKNGKIIEHRKLAKEDGILNQTIAFANWCEKKIEPLYVDIKKGSKILKIAEDMNKNF